MEIRYEGKKRELLEKLRSLSTTANMIADTYENQQIKEKAQQEYQQLLEEYARTPYVVNGLGNIALQYKIEFLNDEVEFKHGETFKYSKEGKAIQVEYDNEGRPVKLKFVTQDPYLHNAPLQIEIPITVDYTIYNDRIRIEPREVIREKEIVKLIPKQIEIPNTCVCGYRLDDVLRMSYCRNCARSLLDIMKEIQQRKLSEKTNNNKKRFKFL
jgi:hypothetical protein